MSYSCYILCGWSAAWLLVVTATWAGLPAPSLLAS